MSTFAPWGPRQRCGACESLLVLDGTVQVPFDLVWGLCKPVVAVSGSTPVYRTAFVCSEACFAFLVADPSWVRRAPPGRDERPYPMNRRTRVWPYAGGYQGFELGLGNDPPAGMPPLPNAPGTQQATP